MHFPQKLNGNMHARAAAQKPHILGKQISILPAFANWNHGNDANQTVMLKPIRCKTMGLFRYAWKCLGRTVNWYGAYADGSETDPIGPNSGTNRILRGGSWGDYGSPLRIG